MFFLANLFGGAGSGPTTTTTPDPRSQAYIERLRRMGIGASSAILGRTGSFFAPADTRPISEQIAPFMDPYLDQVIGGVRSEFDHLRGAASVDAARRATAAGAFGGDRHGVAEGVRLGELDRGQTSQIGGLLSQGYRDALSTGLSYNEHLRQLQERQLQEPIFRYQTALGLGMQGLGPVGSVSRTQRPTNPLGGAFSGALAGSKFGLPGALGGGALGLLGSL